MVTSLSDIDRLRHLVTVAREGSLSAAAAVIPLSQSALTRTIQAIERDYNVQLFRRSQAGVDLTVDGALFVASIERLLHHVQSTEQDLRDISEGNRSVVSFGLGVGTSALFLSEIMPELLQSSQASRYRIRSGPPTLLRDLLRRGEIEFYVGGVPDDDLGRASGTLHFEPIVDTTRLEGVTRVGHPLLQGALTKQRLSTYPIVTQPFALSLLDGMATDDLGVISPSIEADDFGALIELVKSTDTVLLTSSAFRPQLERLGLAALPEALTRLRHTGYGLAYLANQPPSRSTREVADHVVAVLQRLILGDD